MRSTTAIPPAHPGGPADDPHAGNGIRDFLLEQDREVTRIDARLNGYRGTLEPAFSVFDRRLRNPGLLIRQA
jgi:hypothetical protein